MKIPDELIARFQQEGAQEWIGLWAIVWELRQSFPQATAQEIKKLTLELIERLLGKGFVVASVEENVFIRWPDQTSAVVVERISDAWNRLGREPNIGEIAWFNLPPSS